MNIRGEVSNFYRMGFYFCCHLPYFSAQRIHFRRNELSRVNKWKDQYDDQKSSFAIYFCIHQYLKEKTREIASTTWGQQLN